MGTTEEFLRLLVEIKGDQAITDLKKKLADVGVESAKLKAQFDAQAITEAELEAQTRKLAATSASLQAALGQSANKMAGFGQSALQTGRVVQDFAQGGLGGILNNIEGLSMALGGGPGLAGVLTLVGVGFMVFKPQILAAADALGLFKKEVDHTKTSVELLEARIKALNEKPIKLTADVKELAVLEKHLKAIKDAMTYMDALAKRGTSDEKESGARITEAITEGGAARIGEVLTEKRAGQLAPGRVASEEQVQAAAQAAAERHVKANMIDPLRTPEFKSRFLKSIREANEREKMAVKAQARGEVGTLMASAEAGTDPLAADIIATELEDSGEERLQIAASKIRKASPAAIKAERLTEAGKEGAEAARKEREKIDEDNRKAAEEATEFEVKHDESLRATLKGKADAEKKKKVEGGARIGTATLAAQLREAEKGTADEEATAAAARLRAQGGYTNARGKFIPLDKEGQSRVLQEDVQKRLGKGTSPFVAGRIAGKAFDDVDRQKSDLMASGTMTEMGVNLAIVANNQAIFERQLAELRGMNQRTGRVLTEVGGRLRTRQNTLP